ncbi:S8 family serine peptidase [Streptomyces sp. NPDC000594]|uniref:S8 family peptidase n=1 Tax=Streptomyces sp. NPDC000594 TaxID=3154261 RepID=UPI00331A0D91
MFSITRQGRGAVTVTTALATAALVAGLTGSTSFADTGATTSGPSATDHLSDSVPSAAAGLRWVTLITGDRVGVNARGRAVSVDRAKGREKIPVRSFTDGGRSYVIPADAQELIGRGTLDRRLFDVTGLSSAESRRAYRKGLKVIVAYEGSAGPAARKGVRADTAVERSLPSLNADAVTVPERDPGALWAALTRTADARATRTAVPGIERIWLDGVRTADLDKSTGQIGAPKAWEAGYDGKGVTIAVLDTGVDANHPDLKGQVIGAKNFSASSGTADRRGHGTHVAATAAGTGAKNGGTYRGVAPGAKILNGKVLSDRGGGTESSVLAGIEWAVAQGADVINMSLGGRDEPGLDPLESQINKVSEEKGVLFAVSAGNQGPGARTVGSPGSADAALTVGAVDDADKIADFSSIGPRTGDGGIKPDVTAPGVDITAASAPGSTIAREVGEKPAGYVTVSGTSMAAPHAAGAAALLKQRNPDWNGERIKAVLAASAKDGGYTVFQQGTGRIAVDRALEQTVVSDQNTLSFGLQQWPHADDQKITKEITYRNLGDRDVTLDLAVKGLNPKGKAAPGGFFALGADQVTVPAGGTATVPLTVDTTLGGSVNGLYTATVTASGDGGTVRTTAAVDREVESYDLTFNYLGRDGKPSKDFGSFLFQTSGGRGFFDEVSGRSTATLRLPKGDYFLESSRSTETGDDGYDRLINPRLALTKNTTLTVDSRTTKPVTLSIPDTRAKLTAAGGETSADNGERPISFGYFLGDLDGFRVAQLGPKRPTGVTLKETFSGQWERGAAAQYNAIAGGRVDRLATGFAKKFAKGDFAEVTVDMGASAKNKRGSSSVMSPLELSLAASRHTYALPGSRTHYLATTDRTKVNAWSVGAWQRGAKGEWEIQHTSPVRDFRKGGKHRVTLGTAVHSPLSYGESGAFPHQSTGVFRQKNTLGADMALFSDGRGNDVDSPHTSAKTTLHRGTTLIGENKDPLAGTEVFTVGPEEAVYTLATSVKRSPKVSVVGTRIDGSWTFRSKKPTTDEMSRTALSTVRFGAEVALDGTAPAGRKVTFPVTVQGPASGKGLKSLTVSVSYDGGKTWKKVTVTKGKITIKNPAKGKSLALRGEVTDRQGGKASVTVYDAYLGK